jgi:hypothetical protein
VYRIATVDVENKETTLETFQWVATLLSMMRCRSHQLSDEQKAEIDNELETRIHNHNESSE